jgi:tetratricopeptide (TPR) repeat protein
MITPPPHSDRELNWLHVAGKYEQMIVADRENLAYFLHEYGFEHTYAGVAISRLAWSLYENGDFAGAENELIHGMIIDATGSDDFKERNASFLLDLANISLVTNREQEAKSAVDRANGFLANMIAVPPVRTIVSLIRSAGILIYGRELAKAELVLHEAAQLTLAYHKPKDRTLGIIFHQLGKVFGAQGRISEAEDATRLALESYPARETAYYANSLSQLGAYVAKQGNRPAGQSHLTIALEILKRVRPAGHRDIVLTGRRLAKILASEPG